MERNRNYNDTFIYRVFIKYVYGTHVRFLAMDRTLIELTQAATGLRSADAILTRHSIGRFIPGIAPCGTEKKHVMLFYS
jgi:hypothetical protein